MAELDPDYSDVDISDMDLDKYTKLEEVPQPEQGPSQLESAARGTAQGVSWGFVDEITAGIESAFTTKSYEKAVAESREAYKAAEAANPGIYTASEITSSVIKDGALMFIPGANVLRAAKLGKAMAIGAADAALDSWGHGDGDTTAKDVAIDSVLGASIFGAFAGVSKGVSAAVAKIKTRHPKQTEAILQEVNYRAILEGKVPSPDEISASAELLKDQGFSIWKESKRIAAGDTKTASQLMKGPENFTNDFINWQLAKPIGAPVDDAGREQLRKRWESWQPQIQKQVVQNYTMSKAILKAYAGILETKEGRKLAAGLGDILENGFLAKLRSPTQNADLIDEELGTNLAGVISRLNQASDLTAQSTLPWLKRKQTLNNAAKKAGLTEDQVVKSLKGEIDPNKTLSGDQLRVVKGYRNWFEGLRKSLIRQGLNVNHLENYFSRISQNAVDSQVTMTRAWERVQKSVAAGTPDKDEVREFYTTMKYLFPDMSDKAGDAEVRKFLGTMTKHDVSKARGNLPEAFAAFSRREGKIPKMLQEQNLDRVMTSYATMNFKSLHMRDSLEQIQSHIRLFRGMGMQKTAKIWEDYFNQLMTTPSNFQSALNSTSAKIKLAGHKWMDEGGVKGQIGGVVKEVPEFVGWMTTQIYPNYLGFNLHAPLRNMTQTWAVTAPELGGTYGYDIVRKAWLRTTHDISKGINILKELNQKGLRSPDPVSDQNLTEMIEGMGKLGRVGKTIDSIGRWGLKLYGFTDDANRYLTYKAGLQVSQDLLSGNKSALAFLSKVRRGPRQEIEEALKNKNKDELETLVTRYLIDKTQFKYTRPELSQFAREYGRIFNMFTKWPTMIVGDIEYSARVRKGLDKALEPMKKYAPALMLMSASQAWVDNMGGIDPKLQLLIGRDLTKWSPMSAVTGIQAPPLLQIPEAAFRVLSEASKGEIKAAGKELGRAAQPFTPGYFAWRFGKSIYKAAE